MSGAERKRAGPSGERPRRTFKREDIADRLRREASSEETAAAEERAAEGAEAETSEASPSETPKSRRGSRARSTSERFRRAVIEGLIGETEGESTERDSEPGAEDRSDLLALGRPELSRTTRRAVSSRLSRPISGTYDLDRLLDQPSPPPPADAPIAVALRKVSAGYGAVSVLEEIDFEVRQGEVFAILGRSGSGKTTLLKLLVGLLKPTGGVIDIGGKDITRLDGDDLTLVLRRIGLLFQYGALFTSMSVADNVALPLREYTDLDEQAIRALVRLKLAVVGLAGYEERMPRELSGGQRKRAALARAIALDPDLLFFDEPASGLDPLTAAELDALIRHLNTAFGATMVIVTHDLENAFHVAHRILLLDRGRIAALGTPQEIRASRDPWIRDFLARRSTAREAPDTRFFHALMGPERRGAP